MIKWLSEWLAVRRRRKMRKAYNDGFNMAREALHDGTYSVATLRALADGTFNLSRYHREFDRGVNAACDERGDS